MIKCTYENYIKYSLDEKERDLSWNKYNFKGLFDLVLDGYEINKVIFYFARLKKHTKTEEKSIKLIENQRVLKTHLEKQGFGVVFAGRVRGYEEKGVDVRIGVDMVSLSCDKLFDQMILGSSDSDLQPAISESKGRGTKIIYLGFENNPNKGLSYNSNKTILIRNSEVKKFLGFK